MGQDDPAGQGHRAEEFADVLISVALAAVSYGVDVDAALQAKLDALDQRHLVELALGLAAGLVGGLREAALEQVVVEKLAEGRRVDLVQC